MSDFNKEGVDNTQFKNTELKTAAEQSPDKQSLDKQSPEMLKQKSLIIFDWDGTLMDSIGLIVESMHVAGQAHGFTSTDAEIKTIIGLSLEKGIEQIFPQANSKERAAILKSYAEYYIPASTQANQPHSKFFTGIEQMLQTLQAKGKQLAVATGKKRLGLDRVMDHANSHQYFVTSRCADESGSKPDPNMLIEILEETEHSIDDAVFIGDSVHDIKMAQALGMTSIAVSYGACTAEELQQQSPTFQVNTPQELAELLVG